MTLAEITCFNEASEYIEDAAKFGSIPGLERIGRLCDLLGNPEDKLRFIHIAGTNGKGSTAAMIASALNSAGVCVGMYYSPALCGIKDHYTINGKLISDEDYAECVAKVAKANDKLIEDSGESATQFELETAVAFVFFAAKKCDAVVLECGMGGAEDATNIVRNKICCVLASISYDHMQYLGDTLTKIAGVKAGIITRDCTVIALKGDKEVCDAITRRCDDTDSLLYFVDPVNIDHSPDPKGGLVVSYEEFDGIRVSLAGSYQAENAALAMRTLSVIDERELIPGVRIDEEAIRKGLANVRWPYRFERICDKPPVYVDGAHNADAAVKLAKTIDERLPGQKIILVAGVFADKEYDKVMKELAGRAYIVFTVATPGNVRALAADALAECARQYCSDVRVCDSIKEAYDMSTEAAGREKDAVVVAAGSLSYLNEFAKCCTRRFDI